MNIAIIGLGRVGGEFLAKLAEKGNSEIKIIAVAERDENASGLAFVRQKGIKLYTGSREIVAMGEGLDIIFDFTGSKNTTKSIRSDLARSGNQHTILVTELLSSFIWRFMAEGIRFPSHHELAGY